jgi:hypothetical protein
VEVHRLDAVTARGLGIRGDGALLVRPDATPAGWWATAADAAPALHAAIASLAGGGLLGLRPRSTALHGSLGKIKDRVEPNLSMR